MSNDLTSHHQYNNNPSKVNNLKRIRDRDRYTKEKEDNEEVKENDDELFVVDDSSIENLADDMHLISSELLSDEFNELNLCSKHRKLQHLLKNYGLLRKKSKQSRFDKLKSKTKKKKKKSPNKVTESGSQQSLVSTLIKKINCFSSVE